MEAPPLFESLSNGQLVNVSSKEGASALLADRKDVYATHIEQCISVRQRLETGKVRGRTKEEMIQKISHSCLVMGRLVDFGTPDAFDSIPKQDIEAVAAHAVSVLASEAADRRWTTTGTLQPYDMDLLDCVVTLFNRYSFLRAAMNKERNVLRAVAELSAARIKPNLPGARVADAICAMMNNCWAVLIRLGETQEQVMKRFEATGLLGQFLRCATLPTTRPIARTMRVQLIDWLMASPILVKKKLRPGEATGDILADVMAGRDGYAGKRDEQVVLRLENLQKSVELAGTEHVNRSFGGMMAKMCHHCNKASLTLVEQQKLMVCSRCKCVYYCSKECQRTDWKKHKVLCAPYKTNPQNDQASDQNTLGSFLYHNYWQVMKQVIRFSDQKKVPKTELLLELDFFAGKSGSAPAHRDPPEFKFHVTREYLNKPGAHEPDWFLKGTPHYKAAIKEHHLLVKYHYGRMTSQNFLVIIRSADFTHNGVYRAQMGEPEAPFTSLLSDAAVDAIRRAMAGNEAALEPLFSPSRARQLKSCLLRDRLAGAI